jgi:hypothetical protein
MKRIDHRKNAPDYIAEKLILKKVSYTPKSMSINDLSFEIVLWHKVFMSTGFVHNALYYVYYKTSVSSSCT